MTNFQGMETTLRSGEVSSISYRGDSGFVYDNAAKKQYFFWVRKFKTPKNSHRKPREGDRVVFLLGKNFKGDGLVAERVALEEDYATGRVDFESYLSRFEQPTG